ncbi:MULTISPECIES: hypothetical protein [Methylobacterium]|uniref:hypothetical protein n=1 Tax=Methylobacterium TaxID=407 RepID=UPI0013EC547A|nr:hypothetical protein [Methylobacterium sp. DB0501]NGM36482.1 hypothetical protein [Methylobacterium sp. DB0501]
MAFWLRAGLVIGAIYYLSPLRLGEAQPPAPAQTLAPAPSRAAHLPASLGEIAGPVLAMLPESLRARMVETAAAEAGRAVGTGLRAAAAEAAPSRDTLTPHDRQPAWRGVPEREAP